MSNVPVSSASRPSNYMTRDRELTPIHTYFGPPCLEPVDEVPNLLGTPSPAPSTEPLKLLSSMVDTFDIFKAAKVLVTMLHEYLSHERLQALVFELNHMIGQGLEVYVRIPSRSASRIHLVALQLIVYRL